MAKTVAVAALLLAIFVGWEFYALSQDDVWEWSELLNRITQAPFALVAVSWFVGFVMGHAMAPHKSRFTDKKEK